MKKLIIIFSIIGSHLISFGQTPNKQYLNDFTVTPNDRTLEVNVRFWVFVPTNTPAAISAWTYSHNNVGIPTTQADAQMCLDAANSVYTTNPAYPHVIKTGVGPSPSDLKIKLVLKSFSVVPNDDHYYNVPFADEGYYGWGYQPDDAINVLLGVWQRTVVVTYTPTSGPTYTALSVIWHDKIGVGTPFGETTTIHFSPAFYKKLNGHPYWDNIRDY
jgi:hypothetical protein